MGAAASSEQPNADPLLVGACCPPTAHGGLAPAAEEHRGAYVAISGGVGEMYLACPPPSAPIVGAVLVIHDIFGPRVGRHAEICDELASAGFYAACPDLFGDAESRAAANLMPRWPIKSLRNICGLLCCCKTSFLKRAMRTSWEESVAPLLALVISQVEARHSKGPLRWGAVGFCWGAVPVAHLLQEGAVPAVGCGMAFHPSLRGAKAAALCAGVARPLLLCPCGDDPQDVQPGGALAEPLARAFGAGGAWTAGFAPSRPFPEMLHGFMPRGPLEEPAIARDYAEGVQLMRRFFAAHAFAEAQFAD